MHRSAAHRDERAGFGTANFLFCPGRLSRHRALRVWLGTPGSACPAETREQREVRYITDAEEGKLRNLIPNDHLPEFEIRPVDWHALVGTIRADLGPGIH